MSHKGELGAFAVALGELYERTTDPGKEISEKDKNLVNLALDSNVHTRDFAEIILSRARKIETLKVVNEKFTDIEESERTSIAKIALDLSHKIRTGGYDCEKHPLETVTLLFENVPSLFDEQKLDIWSEYLGNTNKQ